jgi:hypothetical protein
MKKFMSLIACGVVAAACTLYAQPKLEIEGGTTHDWGTISFKESPLKADIKLKNVGTEPLSLNDPKPSCGCTTAPLENKELKPGESTVMHVTLNAYTAGPVTKSITITSNDPNNSSVVMYLKANIERALNIAPSYLSFNNLETGKEQSVSVKVVNSSKQDVTLSDFTATNGAHVNFTKPVVVKAGGEVELTATAKPDKVGYYNTTVSMKTNHPDFPVLEVQGYGNVMEPQQSKVFNSGSK